MANLDKIDTIVLLMFENRSFDHMLGHLSLENLAQVNGLRQPLSNYSNTYNGKVYQVYNFDEDKKLPHDLPHNVDSLQTELAADAAGNYTMGGFVKAYEEDNHKPLNDKTEPMGYFNSKQVPISSFLAKSFCVCDKWFCPVPSSTQPNRTFAFSGDTEKENNVTLPKIPISGTTNIFAWLNNAGVRWRVYHDGLYSFFILYPRLFPLVTTDFSHFQGFGNLTRDIQNEPANQAPQVIIVEPSYIDTPHVGSKYHPNDNHAPMAIGWGEDFLRRTYEAVSSNAAKWGRTLMIVYYDEHGGFYDHVPPPKIPYTLPDGSYTFKSMGPRIPGIILSPYVQPGSVCSDLLDHTSVLQLLAEKFTPGKEYSTTVGLRKEAGIASITRALTNPNPFPAPKPPKKAITIQGTLGSTIENLPTGEMAEAFRAVALKMINEYPALVNEKYPELLLWKTAIDNARVD